MLNSLTQPRTILMYVLVAVCLVAIGVAWLLYRPAHDPILAEAMHRASEMRAYTHTDSTQTAIAGRLLIIEGVYHNDEPNRRYASLATTTLIIPDTPGNHSFTLANISIGDEVYTRVASASTLLRAQIAADDTWHQFRFDAIPPAYENISVAGPILDHAQLFRDNGNLLEVVEAHGEEEFAGEMMRRYTLTLSETAHSPLGGTLETLIGRIGEGTIGLWVDDERTIRVMTINNPPFHSTTTFSLLSEPSHIKPPTMEP